MAETGVHDIHEPRCVALVGPYSSGKTTLLEALMARARARSTVRARSRRQHARRPDSLRARAQDERRDECRADASSSATSFTFLDCPGSVEFHRRKRRRPRRLRRRRRRLRGRPAQGARAASHSARSGRAGHSALPVPQQDRQGPTCACATSCRSCSRRASARSCCATSRSGRTGIVTGFIDLALERAFVYREHAPSEVVDIPAGLRDARGRGALLDAGAAGRL